MGKVYYYSRTTKNFIKKFSSAVDNKDAFPLSGSSQNICNISDSNNDEEEIFNVADSDMIDSKMS